MGFVNRMGFPLYIRHVAYTAGRSAHSVPNRRVCLDGLPAGNRWRAAARVPVHVVESVEMEKCRVLADLSMSVFARYPVEVRRDEGVGAAGRNGVRAV